MNERLICVLLGLCFYVQPSTYYETCHVFYPQCIVRASEVVARLKRTHTFHSFISRQLMLPSERFRQYQKNTSRAGMELRVRLCVTLICDHLAGEKASFGRVFQLHVCIV